MDGVCRRVLEKAVLISVLFNVVYNNFKLVIIQYLIKCAHATQANKTLNNDEAKAVICSILKFLFCRALGRGVKFVYVAKQRVSI